MALFPSAFPSAPDGGNARSAAQLVSTMPEDMHAREIETSILLHRHPELARDGSRPPTT